MRLRGVLQSLQSAAERLALGSPHEAMTDPSGETRPSIPRASPLARLPDAVRASRRLPFTLGLITVVLSLCSGLATYLILTGLTPIVPTHLVVVGVLLINLVLVLAMIVIIAWQVTGLWLARQRQVAGAQLHVRIVSLFSVIAVVPAILLAIFASISLDRGLDHWFSVRTKSIIQNSIDVATAYLQEHGQVIRADTVAMAKDIDEAVELVKSQPQGFGNFLTAQAAIRALPMAYLIDGNGKILATAASLPDIPYQAAAARGHGARQERPGDRDRARPDQHGRRHQELAEFHRHLSLRHPSGERARAATAPRDPRQRRRISAARAAPRRRPGGLRSDVCGHRAHAAALRHLDRHVVRQSPGGADPPADGRGAADLGRQSRRECRRPSRRRRPRRAGLDLQHHDLRAQEPARRAGRRQSPSSTSAAVSWRRCCRA